MPLNPQFTTNTDLDTALLDKFLNLSNRGKVQAEYVWLGGGGWDLGRNSTDYFGLGGVSKGSSETKSTEMGLASATWVA